MGYSLGGRAELIAFVVVVVAVLSTVVLGSPHHAGTTLFDLGYLLFPVLFWGCLRFEARVVVLLVSAVSVSALVHASLLHGPFVRVTGGTAEVMVLNLQAFIATLALSVYFLKFALVDHERSEHRRSQLERSALELERQSAISQVSSAAAHDFNNQLTVLTVVAYELLDETEVDSTRRKDIDAMIKAIQSASRLVGQMNRLGRPATNGDGRCNPARVLKSQTPILRRTLAPIQLDIAVPELPDIAMSDSDLSRTLVNLASNAKDAMGDEGRFSVSATPDADSVRITVEDNGPGMSEEVRKRAFEPFFTTKGAGGTGLGLASVAEALKRSGGSIKLEDIAQGTKFVLTVPRAAERQAEELKKPGS